MSIRSALLPVAGLLCLALLGPVPGAVGQPAADPPKPAEPERQRVSAATSVDAALSDATKLVEALEDPEIDEQDAEEKYAAAVKITNFVLELEPLNVRARYLQGRLAMVSGRPRDALPLIEAYINDPLGATDWHARVLLGDLYIISYPEHAKTQYKEASKLAPEESEPHIGLATADVKLSRGEDAIEHARNAIRYDDEERAVYRKTLADAFLLLDDRYEDAARAAREAIEITEKMIREDPGKVGLLVELKTYYELLIGIYNQQFVRYPDRTDVMVDVVRSTLDKADLERLIDYHDAQLLVENARQQPSFSVSADLLYEEARLNRLVGYDERAVELLNELLEREPNHGPGRELLDIIQGAGRLAGEEPTTTSTATESQLSATTAANPS